MNEIEEKEEPAPTDTRGERKRSERTYLALVVFTLVVVGGALIALIFGLEALLTALPCLLAGALTIAAPWLLLTILEKWRDRMEQ